MNSKFLDEIKLRLGFIFVIELLFGIVYAVRFHTANEILLG